MASKEKLKILSKWTPLTYMAFLSYRLKSTELSMEAIEVIKKMIAGKKVTKSTSNLSSREWKELEGLFL